jgi:hypothetical protein
LNGTDSLYRGGTSDGKSSAGDCSHSGLMGLLT